MGLPSQYKRKLQDKIELGDGGYIILKSPTYKEKIQSVFHNSEIHKFEYSAFFDDISSIIKEESDKITIENEKILKENENLILKGKKVKDLKELYIHDIIKILDYHGIPKEAYEEYKINQEYNHRRSVLSYIHKCCDADGNEFTIDNIEEFEELHPHIQEKITASYMSFILDRVGIDLKNLKSGAGKKEKKKKKK